MEKRESDLIRPTIYTVNNTFVLYIKFCLLLQKSHLMASTKFQVTLWVNFWLSASEIAKLFMFKGHTEWYCQLVKPPSTQILIVSSTKSKLKNYS